MNATIETLLRVWDSYEYDNGAVMRETVRALVTAAYRTGVIEGVEDASPSFEVYQPPSLGSRLSNGQIENISAFDSSQFNKPE